MKFCCLPLLGLSVVIEPSRTIFHGPGNIEHQEGKELRFTNGFLEIDESKPENVELIRKLMKHDVWGNPVRFMQSMIPVVVDGRKGQVAGPTLEEALAELDKPAKPKDAPEKEAKGHLENPAVGKLEKNKAKPDPEPDPEGQEDHVPGSGVVDGSLSTANLVAKNKVAGKYRRDSVGKQPAG